MNSNTASNMQTEPDFDTEWQAIIAAATAAANAYQNLLAASDRLAQQMDYREEFILLRVLPSKPEERQDSTRIITWVERQKNSILSDFKEQIRDNKRADLIARLNLTPAELSLLGLSND
jgi:hypothetical protein